MDSNKNSNHKKSDYKNNEISQNSRRKSSQGEQKETRSQRHARVKIIVIYNYIWEQ